VGEEGGEGGMSGKRGIGVDKGKLIERVGEVSKYMEMLKDVLSSVKYDKVTLGGIWAKCVEKYDGDTCVNVVWVAGMLCRDEIPHVHSNIEDLIEEGDYDVIDLIISVHKLASIGGIENYKKYVLLGLFKGVEAMVSDIFKRDLGKKVIEVDTYLLLCSIMGEWDRCVKGLHEIVKGSGT